MRTLVFLLLATLLPAQAPTKEALRLQIADLKVKAFEIQTQVELLEQQLKDLEAAEAAKPLPQTLKGAPVRIRCAGHTKDGTRCTRHAEAGSRFCWQHKAKR